MPREKLYANPRDRARLLELPGTQRGFRNQRDRYIRAMANRWWGLTNSIAVRDDPRAGC